MSDFEFYDDNEDILNSSLYKKIDSKQYFQSIYQNTTLKLGIVTKVYDINDKENINKKTPEYDVTTIEQNAKSNIGITQYNKCICIDGFGGLADFFEYKLRPKSKTVEPSKDPKVEFPTNLGNQTGNMVLLLCLDGSVDKAIIIKSLPHLGRKTNLTKENGVHMEGEYNGVNWKVNKDGEFTLTFRSATNDEGKIINDKYSGTFVKIDKTGSFQAKDKHNFVKMDNDKGGISLTTDATQSTKADKNIELTAKADFIVKSNKWNTEIAGSATNKAASWGMEVSGDVNVKASGPIKLDSSLLDIKTKTVNIQANAINLGVGGAPAIILTTKFIGIGNLGGPVISSPLGPFSSVVFIK
jgi:hypothetical protein